MGLVSAEKIIEAAFNLSAYGPFQPSTAIKSMFGRSPRAASISAVNTLIGLRIGGSSRFSVETL